MKLNVGDLAVITGSRFRPELIGQICTITKPYEERMCVSPNGVHSMMFRYVVRLLDGSEGAFSFRNLRPIEDKEPSTAAGRAVESELDEHP